MNILFLCVHNSARSQIAEGLAKNIFGDSAIIMSAGSEPTYIHPMAIKVMTEINIDISNQQSKSINTIDLGKVDIVITLCSEEICPFLNSDVKKEHWPLPDPSKFKGDDAEQLSRFRNIRDELKKKIEFLKNEITNE